MADKQAGGLSLRIGLTLSQLQSDFLAAEQTVKQGIAAINRQQNIIKLRMEADTAGLDAVADKTKIIEVQERSLTQLLDLQRDKLKLATAAYQDVAQSKGANSTAAKQLETSMERERLAVARLEAQLKSLSAQKISPEANVADVSNAIGKLEEKLEHLNRNSEIIRIRAQVDMEGLDKTADAEKILEIRQRSLNQQLAIQRDRVRILDAQLNDLAQTQGETAISTQRATLRIERERLALARLEREVREVTASISELNSTNINVSGTATISSGTGSSGGSGGAGSSGAGGAGAGSGGGSWTDLLPFDLPTNKIEAFALAIGAVGAVVSKTVDIINDALNDFRETEKQAYELNIDFNDAEQFLRELKLGGGDIGDFEGFIRGITDAYVKGEYDDPEFIALRKYGAQITDATGRLKNFKDLTDEVYQAWKQADEAGEGIEFLQLVGGEAGVRDAIQFFKRYEEAKEDAAKIADANLDPDQWHELERTINLATEQADEFKEAIANIFTPTAQAAAENFFKVFHDGTEWLIENKDALQRWGYVATELIDDLTEFHPSRLSSKLGETLGKILPDDYDEKLNPDSPASKLLDKLFSSDVFKNEFFYTRAIDKQREFNDAVKETTESWSDFRKADEAAAKKLADGDPLSQYGWQRLERYKDELEDLKIELEFGDNDYQKSLAELDLWKQRELTDKLQVSAKEREAIEELYAAKLEQIQRKHAEEIQQYWKNAADIEYNLTHSAFEKQLRDIEQWKDAQMKKAETAEEVAGIIKNAAAKEAEAFEAAMDRIKGKLQSLDDKIFEIDHSQYENDLRRIEQERLQSLEYFQKEGVLTPELKSQIDYLYSRQKQKLDARAAKGGDYTKQPEGAMQRGGNGIMVIGADQIIDDGKINQSIGLIADETQARAQLMQNMTQEGRERVAAVQSLKQLNDAQKQFAQQTSGFQLIEGDQVVNQPAAPQVIEGDQVVADVQQLGDAVQQSTDPVQALKDSAQEAATAQKSLADNVSALPPEYFQNLADGTKAVSEMQLALTKSTMNLKDKFDALATKLESLSTVNQSRDNNQQQTPEGMMKLNYSTQDLQTAQKNLALTTREADSRLRDISDIPQQQPVSTQKDTSFKFGFDTGVFGDLAQTGLAAVALLSRLGSLAPHPAIKAGALILGGAAGAAAGVGSANATYGEQPANQLNALPAEIDLSAIVTPLSNIDGNLQNVLQQMQDTHANDGDRFQEFFGALPNIEQSVNDILLEMQSQAEGESADYLTPLSSISDNVQSISQQLQDTQANENDRLQEYLGALPNIEATVQDILLEMQSRGEVPEQGATLPQTGAQGSTPDSAATIPQTPAQTALDYTTLISGIDGKLQSVLDVMPRQESISFETVVRPLDNIATIVGNILTALENRQPPQITVSPNNNIDLGGAYVFDNAMKRELVDDITSSIVNHITDAVSRATSSSNYNFSA